MKDDARVATRRAESCRSLLFAQTSAFLAHIQKENEQPRRAVSDLTLDKLIL